MGSVSQAINWGLANLTAPVSGTTHAVRLIVNINNETLTLSLASLAQTIGDFRAQAMTIDNTQGTAAVVVSETVYGWSRTVDAGVGQTFQFPAVPNPIFQLSTTGAVVNMIWSLFDWPAFPDTWNNNGNAAGGSTVTIAGQPISVDVLAEPAEPVGVYNAAAAFAVAVGGTPVVVFPANSFGGLPGYPGGQAVIVNPAGATESLFVDAVGLAAAGTPGPNGTTVELLPGQSITFQPSGTQDITANAATNGHAFVAYSWGG